MQSFSRFFGYAGLFGLAFLLGGCGGRAISKRLARDVIVNSPADALMKGDLDVLSVSQVGSREAVVVTNLRSAFRIEKVGNEWKVREVRVGKGEWETLDSILRALQQVKIDDTRRLLEQIGNAIETYRRKNGHLPEFKDYVELSDALNPLYLSPLVRLDPWNHPLAAYRLGTDSIRIASAGPDGKLGTADDIELNRIFTPRPD